ncbi:MAG: CAP domain-containing protein [Myxococcota bacterium]
MTTSLLLCAALAVAPGEMEKKALRHVTLEFERIGRSAPQHDVALTRAARALATEALASSVSEAADLLTLVEAVSDAGGTDASPRAFLLRGTPAPMALDAFLQRRDFNDEPASHVGVGVVAKGDIAALVMLLSERKAELQPFARQVKPKDLQSICGNLAPHLSAPEVFVTRPSGKVDKLLASSEPSGHFCTQVGFSTAGRHTFEVIAHGERGPEVAALAFVHAGAKGGRDARVRQLEPPTVEAARREVASRINSLRNSNGLSGVALDVDLDHIAQAYADRMAREGFFGHVAPEGADLRGRLTHAGYSYRTAGENLGMAAGPLAAHFGIEHSPGHRKTLLEDGYTRLGLGIAVRRAPGCDQTLLVEILAAPQPSLIDTYGDAYQALLRARAGLHLPPLQRNAVLERLAGEHARKALELDQPTTQLPGEKLHQRVFATLDDAASAAVDFFLVDHPSLITDSKNLGDARNAWVGVGAVKGDSARYGKGKYWVVVIYAARQSTLP